MILALAPMAGLTDPCMRVLAYRYGANHCVSEMISAIGLVYAKKTNDTYKRLLAVYPEEPNTAAQIFGADPILMGAAAAKITALNRYAMLDINMGCPVRKVVSGGEGSALLLDPDRAFRIMKAVKENTDLPVTVKTRLGFDEDHMTALEIGLAAQEAGLKWITLHGRTRQQMYSGRADWEGIARVREGLTLPVIANGDITSAEDAERCLAITGAAGIAIGRGAMGNPQLFRQISTWAETGIAAPRATFCERLDTALEHTRMKAVYEGERVGVTEMRTHLGHYVAGMRGAAALRRDLCSVSTIEDVERLLERIQPDAQAQDAENAAKQNEHTRRGSAETKVNE